ncbi:MAG: spore germination protein [Bacillota bacterium]
MFFERLLKPRVKFKPSRKSSSPEFESIPITECLEENLQRLAGVIGQPLDLVIHRIEGENSIAAALVYLRSLVDGPLLGSQIVEPINNYLRNGAERIDHKTIRNLFSASDIIESNELNAAVNMLLSGKVLALFSGTAIAFSLSFPGFPRRPIEDALNEKVMKGPREGFSESLQDNLSLVRRWIKDPNLQVEAKTIGRRTQTELAILYLKDVAKPSIVQEVHKRLEQVDIDGIIDSGYISELITDNKYTYFPLVQETERPDKVVAGILEGRVAILVDKSSFNIIVPVTSTEYYQIREDFTFNYWTGSFLRFIRAFGTVISVALPGFYLATVSVNPELLPPILVQLIASSRVQVPFPLVVETLLAMLIFEIFRESTLRMPGNVSNILGISGGVLLGQAALSISIVAPATVVVVVITSLATFTTADSTKEQAWRITRYFLFAAAAAFGIYGLSLAGFVVLTHMANLKSFGVSYLAPWGPPIVLDMLDAYIRLPWWASYRRPATYRPQDEDRLDIDEEGGDKG